MLPNIQQGKYTGVGYTNDEAAISVQSLQCFAEPRTQYHAPIPLKFVKTCLSNEYDMFCHMY